MGVIEVLQGILPQAALVLLFVGSLISIWYFVIYLASIFLFRREEVREGSGQMRFLVLIPTYNDDVSPSVVSSARARGNVDVLVVDTSDREEVWRENEKVCRDNGADYVHLPRGGYKAWNLNRGIERADLSRYDYVLILDADASVPEDFFLKVEGYLQEDPVEILQTEWRPYPGLHEGLLSYFSWVYAAVFQRLVVPVLNFFDAGLVFGNGFLVRSDVFKKLRFDERFIAEDFKFALDVLQLGGRVRYFAGTGTRVTQPVSLTEMAKQLERWGYGSAQIILHELGSLRLSPPIMVILLTGISAHLITPAYVLLALLSSLLLPSPGIPLSIATAAYVIGLLPLSVITAYQMRTDGVRLPLVKKVLSYLLNLPFWFVFTWQGVVKASMGLPLRWDPTEKVMVNG